MLLETAVSRVVDCPSCHVTCEWCAWYAKNARAVGCGLHVPSGVGGRRARRFCAWGEALRGTTCAMCGGAEKVRLVGRYEVINSEAARE